MFNLFLGIILFIGLIVFAIFSGGSIETFMDMPSLIIVVVGALIYSFSSGGDATDRLDNFGVGAVRMGWIGFIIGMVGWLYIVYEIFFGEAANANNSSGNESAQKAFVAIRAIVTFGWAIYPIGYALAYFGGSSSDNATLNIVYNLADLINKAAFGLAIWVAATSSENE